MARECFGWFFLPIKKPSCDPSWSNSQWDLVKSPRSRAHSGIAPCPIPACSHVMFKHPTGKLHEHSTGDPFILVVNLDS